jgi:hypothetical protein
MGNRYPPTDENSGEVYDDSGTDRLEAWHTAPVPDAVPPAAVVGEGSAVRSPVSTPVSAAGPYVPVGQNQSAPRLYAHKNEVLYAFGGLFFPGLVLLLMGGQKRTGIIMLCCLVVSVALSVILIGIPLLIGTYIWSVIACFREAKRQNQAHGFES